ncbi:MAG: hypothetical protein MAGBODY4_00280 [Candidatus Marinimicrobia bacterium]|nr:hypothetical protein [Candidatus Neomarinimicrobiota bacterium]
MRKLRFYFVPVDIRAPLNHRLRLFTHYIGPEQSEGTEYPRMQRDQYFGNSKGFGNITGMERPGAAKGDQGCITGVIALFQGNHPNGALHFGIRQIQDGFGQLSGRCAHRIREFSGNVFSLFLIEFNSTAENSRLWDSPGQKVGIRHRQLHTAAIIADRAGLSPGALWANLEHSSCIFECNRSATGTDGVNVDHRQGNR